MRNIAEFAITRPLYAWLVILVCLGGGLWGVDTVGRLEDPAFPIKNAFIITQYPGASAHEVEQEVTDVVEAALQELPYVDTITSKSVPGRSEVQVELLEHFGPDDLPQIWDELRRRIQEAASRLPPGTHAPLVEDDYGDVFGILYAITAPDYSDADVFDISKQITKQLKLVSGVAKVNTAGEPYEAVYVELDQDRLVRLGLPADTVFGALASENSVMPQGSLRYGERRVRLAPERAFDSATALGDMRIGKSGSTEILRLSDVATITRESIETQPHLVRYQGQRAFTVGVSISDGSNVVKVGRRVDDKMREILATLPVGVDVSKIYAQHEAVDASILQFLKNLGLSVLTVFVALFIFMGWRAGIVVGSVLLLTVLGTIGLMSLFGIDLQRISLGALMISMGMLVDNAIVIAEGMVVGVHRGQTPTQAATNSAKRTQFALLGATVIGILAFAPIGLSDDNSGYFLRALFQVVAISLLLSWVLAITVVPMLGSYLLVSNTSGHTPKALYSGWAYAPYRGILRVGLRHAWLSTLLIIAVVGACFWAFQFVKPGFFPQNNTPLFYLDYHLVQGTDINTTADEIAKVEDIIRAHEEVTSVATFVGRGASRFVATQRPEQPNPAYAQLVIQVSDLTRMDSVMGELRDALDSTSPNATLHFYRMQFSPGGNYKIEARFSGPNADVLRDLADRTLAIYLAHDLPDRNTDWRQREIELTPKFDDTRARIAGISRNDVAQALAFATNGVAVGLYRDRDKVIPIIARAPAAERIDVEALADRLVWSPAQQTYIPMSQVVQEFTLVPADNLIYRRNRLRTITTRANPPPGHNPTHVFNALRDDVEAIPLPPGYQLEWGGEYEGSQEANTLLVGKIPTTFGGMLLITILMFGQMRQPIVIWLTVPMSVCGLVIALIVTDLTFTFPTFLGLLSLSGMLIKNCIVLVDEIDKRIEEQGASLATLEEASISRMRPVLLAAGTTIAGMAPLLTDAFFQEMAVGIMGGLAFATFITLLAIPVFYRIALGRRVLGRPASGNAVTTIDDNALTGNEVTSTGG